MKAVKFINSTKEDFSHNWDGQPYGVKSGESIMLPSHIALHLAKHLAIRELNKVSGKGGLINTQNMPPMMDRFIITTIVEADSPAELEVKIMNKKPKSLKKKPGRPKKEVAEVKEFADLKE